MEDDWDELQEWTPDADDVHEAVDLIDQLCGALIAESTKGGDGNPRAYRKNHSELAKILRPLGIRHPFPWQNLHEGDAFARGSYVSYNERRELFMARAEQVKGLLATRINDDAAGDVTAAVHGLLIASEELIAPTALRKELQRMESSLSSDPSAVIGKSKNLIEATAKAVLAELGQPYRNANFITQAKGAMKALGIDPETTTGYEHELAIVAASLTELTTALRNLRNQAGDAHGYGDDKFPVGLDLRYGRLAARSAIAWAAFMLDTLHDRQHGRTAT
ncbi:abortive infection family protein [Nocardia sp. NPDC050378]|uniref:abortive infection family protein n=1 Tax=Nocardia sp. NPDC050378 TaxID=3155400 RepID=UPI0033CB8173